MTTNYVIQLLGDDYGQSWECFTVGFGAAFVIIMCAICVSWLRGVGRCSAGGEGIND